MAEANFLLYSTSACHLCEQAEALLLRVQLPQPVRLDIVDISDDDLLIKRYGTRIPVLVRLHTDGEVAAVLAWPFDALSLRGFLLQGA
jgi:Glutaredoxin-like domain (DUF836)